MKLLSYVTLVALLSLMVADVAFAQGLTGGGGTGPGAAFSGVWSWLQSNIFPALIMAGIVIIGITMIARRHSISDTLLTCAGLAVLDYAATLAGLFPTGN